MSSRCGAERPPQRICFFGTYPREYTVTRLLACACRAAGITVIECHRPVWEQTRHKPASYFATRSATRLLLRYLRQARALARDRRGIGPVSLYLIGFSGQFDCLLLRLLMRRERTPVLFAPLVTVSETLIEDRHVFGSGSLRSHLVQWLDHASLSAARRVIMDTEAHRRYVIDTFGLPEAQVSVWYLGADTTVFRPTPLSSHNGPLRVLFIGSFLPLHGLRTVLEAAALLRHDPRFEFTLVGDGPERQTSIKYAHDAALGRVHFVDWAPYEMLGELIAGADICLGIFGTTRKTQMVIPNKVYQTAAVGRPIVTADTPAVREVFVHGETAWLCPAGDAQALADALRTLADDERLRERLASRAATLMRDRFSPHEQGRRLADIFAAAVSVA